MKNKLAPLKWKIRNKNPNSTSYMMNCTLWKASLLSDLKLITKNKPVTIWKAKIIASILPKFQNKESLLLPGKETNIDFTKIKRPLTTGKIITLQES